MTAKVVSMINLKGGVGKSTLAMMLGEYASHALNKKVLLIDFDSQSNLTSAMVRQLQVEENLQPEHKTIYHLFEDYLSGGHPSVIDYICPKPEWVSNIDFRPGVVLDIVISTPELAGLDESVIERFQNPGDLLATLHRINSEDPELVRSQAPGLEEALRHVPIPESKGVLDVNTIREVLRTAIEPAKSRYDVIIIDAPPGLSLFTSAAIVASDFYVSPVIPEPLSIMGINLIRSRVNVLIQRMSLPIQFGGSILNKVMAHRRGHAVTAERMYGGGAGGLPPFPFDYRPFKYYVTDAERFRQVSQYDCELLPGGDTGRFGGVHDKYGATLVDATNPARGALHREEDGKKFHLSRRCRQVTEEFLERIGA